MIKFKSDPTFDFEFERALSNLIAQNLTRNWSGRHLIVTEKDKEQAWHIVQQLRRQVLSFPSLGFTERLISIGKEYGPGLVSPMIFAMGSIEWQGVSHVSALEAVIFALVPDWLEMPATPFVKSLGYTESFQTVYYISQCFAPSNWYNILGVALANDLVRGYPGWSLGIPPHKARQIVAEQYSYVKVLAAGALLVFLDERCSLFRFDEHLGSEPLRSPQGHYVNMRSIKQDATKNNRDLINSIYKEMQLSSDKDKPFFSTIYRDCMRYVTWWLEVTNKYVRYE